MASEHFFSELPIVNDFTSITDLSNFSELPNDWYVVVADIQNSTIAIKKGLYKAVNILGVSVITSILNSAKPINLPYVFGGDGATLCIPNSLLSEAQHALLATKSLSKKEYGLHLRVGYVPIDIIHKAGHKILVARHQISEHYIQAAFAGGGVEYAETLIKDEELGKAFRLEETIETADADYSGLECRWENIPSQHGEIISLIVQVNAPSIEEKSKIFHDVILKIDEIYGNDESCRPVYLNGLHTTFDRKKLIHETKVRTFGKGKLAYCKYSLLIRLQNILGWIFMNFKLTINGVAWGDYKIDLIKNSDFKKFDGLLREVISGTSEQRKVLENYLEKRFKENELVYGIHSSDSALVTCMINNRSGDHYHFIDGSDGGYAMAASKMKEQFKKLAQHE